MIKTDWILCPLCGHKTREKVNEDTEMKNFPLFCPKCRGRTVIDVKHFKVSISPQASRKAAVPEDLYGSADP